MRVTERLRRTVEVRGAPIDLTPTEWGLLLALAAADPGQRVELTIIRAGDIIRQLGPVPTPDAGALLSALAAADPGQRVELTIARSGQTRAVPVTLGTLEAT